MCSVSIDQWLTRLSTSSNVCEGSQSSWSSYSRRVKLGQLDLFLLSWRFQDAKNRSSCSNLTSTTSSNGLKPAQEGIDLWDRLKAHLTGRASKRFRPHLDWCLRTWKWMSTFEKYLLAGNISLSKDNTLVNGGSIGLKRHSKNPLRKPLVFLTEPLQTL